MLIDGIQCLDGSATQPPEDGTPVTLPVDADVLGREIHKHLTPDHPVAGCTLCKTEIPSTFFIPTKACCGVLECDECECGPGEFSEVFDRQIMCRPASRWSA